MNEELNEFLEEWEWDVGAIFWKKGDGPFPIDAKIKTPFEFAQAVADFTEKRALEELREKILNTIPDYTEGCTCFDHIDQRLLALKAGEEKDGNS